MKMFAAAVAAGVLAVPSMVMAASSTSTLSVHVPFSFVMAGQEFQAGDYRVQQNDNGIICVQGSGKAAMVLSVPASSKPGSAPSLQFANMQDGEHLVGVQVDGTQLRSIPVLPEAEHKLTVASTR